MRSTETKLTAVSRRGFLAALGGLALSPAFARTPLAENLTQSTFEGEGQLFASAYKKTSGHYGIGLLDEFGQVLAEIGLPGRGHGVAVSEDRSCLVAFARRPGTFAVVIRAIAPQDPELITAAPGRHFFGHGSFSADGQLLYAVENDFHAARGVIGVYDLTGAGVRRIGELDSHGVGPHEMVMAPDGKTLVIANGGIETHPDKGREKLNLATMAPSIVYLDAETGDLLSEHRLDAALHQVSLRHMALDGDGHVWVGGQYEGPAHDTPPLVAKFTMDGAPELLEVPGVIASTLQNYIGSVAANKDGSVIATSAPRCGQTLFWDAQAGAFLGSQRIIDGCGVAPIDQGSFLISDGNGGLSIVDDPGTRADIIARSPGYAWDNHMSALTG
ncbi:DUF1513 domain-containing protein [Roseibium denhamense]|uniref:DUF1513 domain-containing protein n=1 Tax=Roseibium denhamense TaxID=76305 RepID=A0ABY1PC96_9HYPH|nr:DUF1513 domain-containing protein [Roseibium denhamense]MTI07428.1 DUF1513 domain-containing protein [Roseibium denhamense]SMP29580.1 hypothetical protein SAMN06265374_3118 [Roseibium denhamense]